MLNQTPVTHLNTNNLHTIVGVAEGVALGVFNGGERQPTDAHAHLLSDALEAAGVTDHNLWEAAWGQFKLELRFLGM